MKARCRWCGRGFLKIDRFYWCESAPCRKRQAEGALTFQNADTGEVKPFDIPLPVGVDFDLAQTPMLLGGGAAGVSKSHFARRGLYRRCFQIPGFEALLIRKTWNELEKHHLRLMEREALQMKAEGLPVEYLSTPREFRVHHPTGDSVIEGGHLDDGDIDKYLSRERDAIVADEGSTLDPNDLLALSTRARSTKEAVADFARKIHRKPEAWTPPRGGAVFWVLSNPGGPASAMLRDFFIDHSPDYERFPQLQELDSDGRPLYDPTEWGYIPGNLEDNPYLPPSYERDLAVLQPWRYQQLRFNNWDVLAGQFFPEFDARIHVKDLGTLGGDVQWFRSYDYGFMDPGVCLWWAILPDSRYYIRAEYKHQHLNIGKICHGIRKQTGDLRIPRVKYTIADKYSMGQRESDDDKGKSRGDMFRDHGVPVTPVSQDRAAGWTQVRELLGLRPDALPWLIIHPSCRYLIRTLAGAVSSKTNPEDIEEKDDHALDSCFTADTMIATEYGERRIVDVRVNDRVWTREGLKPVEAVFTVGKRDTRRVRLSTRRSLIGTPDHRIWVKNTGWVNIDTLGMGDILEPCPVNHISIETLGRSGAGFTDLSRPDTTSTTGTKTTGTTSLRTSVVSLARSISAAIQRAALRRLSRWRGLSADRESGTGQRPAGSGIAGTASTLGWGWFQSRSHASVAARRLPTARVDAASSAPSRVSSRWRAEADAWMTREPASCAGKASPASSTTTPEPAADPAVSVRAVFLGEYEQVYNLTVADCHEYFANGVLVANCRMGAMSRPSVARFVMPKLPPNAVGHLLREAQRGTPKRPFAFR